MTRYYIWGRISKVYYGYTTEKENAMILLKDAKRHHPQEDWEIKTEEYQEKREQP